MGKSGVRAGTRSRDRRWRGERVALITRMPVELAQRVRQRARADGTTVSDWLSARAEEALGRGTGPGEPVDVGAIKRAATRRRARQRLDRIEEMRDARCLATAGQSVQQIADHLDTTEARALRMLKATEGRSVDEVTPEEVILQLAALGGDRRRLVERLSKCTFTYRQHAPEPFDGAISGSWDDVRRAVTEGLLSQDEYDLVCQAVAARETPS